MSAPRMSVIMTVYNDARYVAGAVASVLSQDAGDFEFLIVDDGSTDKTPEVLSQFTDERIRVIRQANAGVAAGLNRALAEAAGEILVRQDADDESLPGRFSAQLARFGADPDLAVLGTGFQQIDSHGRVQGTWPGMVDLSHIQNLLLVDNPFMHGSVMIRADVMRDAGGYRPAACEDFELWTRLAGKVNVANLETPFSRWRWHTQAVSKHNAGGLAADAVAIRRPYLRRRLAAPLPPPAQRRPIGKLLARRLGHDYFELGRLFFAARAYGRAAYYFDLARVTHATGLSCLWNRLYAAKYRISRRELQTKHAICRLEGKERDRARRTLDARGRFPYSNPILEEER